MDTGDTDDWMDQYPGWVIVAMATLGVAQALATGALVVSGLWTEWFARPGPSPHTMLLLVKMEGVGLTVEVGAFLTVWVTNLSRGADHPFRDAVRIGFWPLLMALELVSPLGWLD